MISIFIRTVFVYVILNILLKLMGKRQIGELEVSELVATLLISEIASISISDPDIPLFYSIVPIVFICATEIILAAVKNRSSALKRIVEGEPVYVIYKGRLRKKALDDNRISINEIITEMRTQNIGDISEIYYGILEQNGQLSFFLKKDKNKVSHILVIDGKTDEHTLKELKLGMDFIESELEKRNLNIGDVFLMTINDDHSLNIIKKEEIQ